MSDEQPYPAEKHSVEDYIPEDPDTEGLIGEDYIPEDPDTEGLIGDDYTLKKL